MRAAHSASFRRRRGHAESHNQFRMEPNHVLELHEPHPLTYYSRMEWGSSVCDRCRRLCFDEGWRCDKEECETMIQVADGERFVPTRPFFCTTCFTDAARVQSECLGAVIAEKANRQTTRKTRTPNLRTNWRAESNLLLGEDLVHFESLVTAIILGRLERVKEIVDHSEFSRHIQIEDTLMMADSARSNNSNANEQQKEMEKEKDQQQGDTSKNKKKKPTSSLPSPPSSSSHAARFFTKDDVDNSNNSNSNNNNTNFALCYGKTPLLLAAEGGHRAIVTLLLERGANREVADIRHGLTPLMVASLNGHSAVVDELVHAGVTIDRLSSSHGYSASHYAAVNGHAAVLRRLIKFGSDVLIRTPRGRTPLIIAACNGHLDAVMELCSHMMSLTRTRNDEHQNDDNDEGDDDRYNGENDVDENDDDDDENENDSTTVVMQRSIALESILLPDYEGYTAVDIAIARGHNSVVNYLEKQVERIKSTMTK